MAATSVNDNIRYEPDENPPSLVAIGAGVQAAMIIVAPVVLTVVIVARIAQQPESYLSWAVFAALIICGATTMLQAVRVGRVGAGRVLIMGTSGAFIGVCVAALVEGGAVSDGEPHRRVVALSILAGRAALATTAHLHAGGLRHRNYADTRHGYADSIRYAEGRA